MPPPRRRSAACADRRTARRHRPNLRPTFAPPVRRRPWLARARGHGAAAVLTAAQPRAALLHSLRQLQLRLQLKHRLLGQIRQATWLTWHRNVEIYLSYLLYQIQILLLQALL